MGGIWDPVSDDFVSYNGAFHVMMVLYFFTSVVLMLNVLIALINVAFNKGDDGWRLVWIESRLRYIEAAENMSYHIPGFRRTYDYFPDEIYFSVTHKQVQEINRKLRTRTCVVMDLDEAEKWVKEGSDEDDALEANDEDVDAHDDEVESATGQGEGRNNNSKDNNRNVEINTMQEAAVKNVLEPQVKGLVAADREEPGSYSGGSQIDSHKGKETSTSITQETSSVHQGSQDREVIRKLNRQVNDLHKQVTNLQKQLSDHMTTQQERVERRFEELKGLLLQHSAR